MSGQQRENGRRILLGEIRRSGRVPRIDLAQRTGISRATVTTITAELLREGLIEEHQGDTPDSDGKRGRPKVDLKIRGQAHLMAGAKISNHSVSLVLIDFEGNTLTDLEAKLDAPVSSAQALARKLGTLLSELAARHGCTSDDISGLGVGIAGIVDAPRGFVYWSPSLTERNVGFANILTAHLGLPAFVDNDANLVAIAEKSFGLGRAHSDFIVVTIESGVGMGIVIGDEIYRGTRGCGAEFGHTKVQLDGALCRCGQRGCLEAYVADYALLREARIEPEVHCSHQVEALLQAGRTGDPRAGAVVRRAGQVFAMGLANIVNIFDPELIILAGEQMQFDHLYSDEVIAAMRRSIVQIDKPPPEVVVHEWGDLMWARGAAAYALDNVSERALMVLG